jgi:hypothetical protein
MKKRMASRDGGFTAKRFGQTGPAQPLEKRGWEGLYQPNPQPLSTFNNTLLAHRIATNVKPAVLFPDKDTASPTHTNAGDIGYSLPFQHLLELKSWMTNSDGQLNGKRYDDFPQTIWDKGESATNEA